MKTIEQAHQVLRNVLLNGRISINGQPLTANELNTICAHELALFSAAKDAKESESTKKEPK